jgi:hypothetical protein
LQEAGAVQFYEVSLTTIPERQQENPIARRLLFEMKSGAPRW